MSSACRLLISKILAPLKIRVRISGIKNDPWFNYVLGDKAGGSRDQSTVSCCLCK